MKRGSLKRPRGEDDGSRVILRGFEEVIKPKVKRWSKTKSVF